MALSDILLVKQPFRGIYITYVFLHLLLVHLPTSAITSLPPFKPYKRWPFVKTLRFKLLQRLLYSFGMGMPPITRVPNHEAIENDLRPNNKGVWIEPADSSLIRGKLKEYAAKTKVVGVRIPGYWFLREGNSSTAVPAASPNEKLILNFHGGGYVAQSAFPGDITARIPRGALQHVKEIDRALSIEYRLSAGPPYNTPKNPFPAALLDALAAYNYVINVMKFKAENVVVMGDSAGANLTLALTRYLKEANIPSLPLPHGLILHSPWTDLGLSHGGAKASITLNAPTDYLGTFTESNGYTYPVKAFTGTLGGETVENEVYISAASKNLSPENVMGLFKGFPSTLIVSGGKEQLIDSIQTLRDRMKLDLGDQLEYVELEDTCHDPIAFDWAEPERTIALQKVASWFTRLYPEPQSAKL